MDKEEKVKTLYKNKFKGLLIATAKGFGIGMAISIVLVALIFGNSEGELVQMVELITTLMSFTIILGLLISAFLYSKSSTRNSFMGAASGSLLGLGCLFVNSREEGNGPLAVIGIVNLFICLVIMIPVGIFMALSYFLNFIYLGIMFLLEKKNKLENRTKLCNVLDYLVSLLTVVITTASCVAIVKIIW